MQGPTGTGDGDPEQKGGSGQGTVYERARPSTKSPPTFVILKVQVMVLPGDAEGGQDIVIPRPAPVGAGVGVGVGDTSGVLVGVLVG